MCDPFRPSLYRSCTIVAPVKPQVLKPWLQWAFTLAFGYFPSER
jgi:hypothetical protein